MATLADRLLAGEHHGCSSWVEVASKLGVGERRLRVVRAILADKGTPVSLIQSQPESSNMAAQAPVIIQPSVPRWVGKSLAEFDAADFRDEETVLAAQQPYEPASHPDIKRLTRENCPDGSLILWMSDIHIPIHDERVCRIIVDCAERVGVTHVVPGGDVLDFNCLSSHAKESRRMVEHSTLMEEIEPGRWLLNWFGTKRTTYLLGNHEIRLQRFIDENPIFHGSILGNFAKVVDLPAGIEVLPEDGEVQLGNLSMFHGSAEFKKSSGGPHPAARLLTMLPEQSSMCGHLHRITTACRTTRDEAGILRTRRGWTMGHLSREEMHRYAGKHPNWQVGFGLIRVWWEGDRPRFSVYQVEVLFDRQNRPYFELWGSVYR